MDRECAVSIRIYTCSLSSFLLPLMAVSLAMHLLLHDCGRSSQRHLVLHLHEGVGVIVELTHIFYETEVIQKHSEHAKLMRLLEMNRKAR